MMQALRGLGEKSFQQSCPQGFKKNLDTMSITVEIVYLKPNLG